jgi:hypothetical protein
MLTSTPTVLDTEECGACGRRFPTLSEVFSHPCDGLPAHLFGSTRRHATTRGDNIDAPDHGDSAGAPAPKPERSNQYSGECVRCHTRVDANAGLLVKNHAGGHGASWGVEHRMGDCPAAKPAPTPAPAPAATVRRNKFAGPCRICRHEVPAAAGLLRNENGRWVVEHDGGCRTDGPPAPPAGYEPARGDVHVIDGAYYRVHKAQGTDRFYACRWTGAEWDYDRGAMRLLSDATRATPAQAAAFGHMTGGCVFCSRAIDTPESTAVGYGPVCAAKHGLPWGTA